MSSPSVGSAPIVRGSDKRSSASSIVKRSMFIVLNSDTIFGFSIPVGGSSIVPHCTYGPYRPDFAKTGKPSRSPIGVSPFGAANKTSAASRVSSSGVIVSGTPAVFSPLRTYGPYKPGLTMTSSPVSGCAPNIKVLSKAASMVSRLLDTTALSPGRCGSSSTPQ